MIKRELNKIVISRLNDEKAIVILGARQVGKTTFIEGLLNEKDYLLIDCDDQLNLEILENANTETLKQIIGSHKIVFFDEAQRIKNIGLLIKIIVTNQYGIYAINVLVKHDIFPLCSLCVFLSDT